MSRTTGAGTAALPELKMWEKCYYLRLLYKENIFLRGTRTTYGYDPSADNCHYLLVPNQVLCAFVYYHNFLKCNAIEIKLFQTYFPDVS